MRSILLKRPITVMAAVLRPTRLMAVPRMSEPIPHQRARVHACSSTSHMLSGLLGAKAMASGQDVLSLSSKVLSSSTGIGCGAGLSDSVSMDSDMILWRTESPSLADTYLVISAGAADWSLAQGTSKCWSSAATCSHRCSSTEAGSLRRKAGRQASAVPLGSPWHPRR